MLLAPIRKDFRISGVEESQASPSILARSLCAHEGDAIRIEKQAAAAAPKSVRFMALPFREPRASEGLPEIIGRKRGRRHAELFVRKGPGPAGRLRAIRAVNNQGATVAADATVNGVKYI